MARLRAVGDDGEQLFRYDAGNTYDPREIFIESTNKHDHRERTQISLPQGTLGQIKYVTTALHDSYKGNVNAFIRDAVHHRLHTVNEWIQDESLGNHLAVERAENRAARLYQQMQEAEETLNNYKRYLESAVGTGHKRILIGMIEAAADSAEEMDEPYKSRLLNEVKAYQDKLNRMD